MQHGITHFVCYVADIGSHVRHRPRLRAPVADVRVAGGDSVIILNFSHPLTPAQVAQIETLTGQLVERTVDTPAQFDNQRDFVPQVTALADACGLTPAEWQTAPLAIVPPALSFIAVTLLAELHGRMGYFPSCVRLRPVAGAVPPRYEVAEVLGLQEVREKAREKR